MEYVKTTKTENRDQLVGQRQLSFIDVNCNFLALLPIKLVFFPRLKFFAILTSYMCILYFP